jgi:hypothetical protein
MSELSTDKARSGPSGKNTRYSTGQHDQLIVPDALLAEWWRRWNIVKFTQSLQFVATLITTPSYRNQRRNCDQKNFEGRIHLTLFWSE